MTLKIFHKVFRKLKVKITLGKILNVPRGRGRLKSRKLPRTISRMNSKSTSSRNLRCLIKSPGYKPSSSPLA